MNNISTSCLNITVTYLNEVDLHQFSQTSSFMRSVTKHAFTERKIALIFEQITVAPGLLIKDVQKQKKHLDELKPNEKLKHLQVIIVTSCFKSLASANWLFEHSQEFHKRKNIDDKILYLKSVLNKEIKSSQVHLLPSKAPILTLLLSLSRPTNLFAIDDGTYNSEFYGNLSLMTTQIFLEWGANPNGIPDGKKDGNALAMALVNNKEKHLRLLKKYGAQPDTLSEGKSALQQASSIRGNVDILAKFLELFNPNPFLKDSQLHTPKDNINYLRNDHERYSLLAKYEKQYLKEVIASKYCFLRYER